MIESAKLVKPSPLEIPEDDPFANDRLDRKADAELLSNIIASTEHPVVISVDAPWGGGKTTFVRMWQQMLKQRGHPTVYFNAWASDYVEDPLIAFIGEFEASLEATRDPSNKTLQQRWERMRTIGAGVLRITGPLAIRLATQGLLNLDNVRDAFSPLGETGAIAEFTESLAQDRLQSYKTEKRAAADFRETLAGVAEELTTGEGQEAPVVVFVDELDRCRPSYAVALLERMKHLFDVSRIVFVLALDGSELAHTVRALYGQGFGAEGYLRRFIDFDYHLGEPSHGRFADYLVSRFALDEVFQNSIASRDERGLVVPVFGGSAAIFDLTLRDQEQAFMRLNLALRAAPDGTYYLYTALMAFMAILRTANLELYKAFLEGTADADDIIQAVRSRAGGVAFVNSKVGALIEAYLIYASHEKNREVLFREAEARAKRDTPDDDTAFRDRQLYVNLQNLSSQGGDHCRQALLDRLELVSRRVGR